MRFNSPPNWPTPPPGWTPPLDWQPDPSWGPPPPGWQLWVADAPKKNRTPLILGGIVAVVAVAAIIVTILYLTVWSNGKNGESDEDQIRSVVAGMEDAWNDSDLDAFEGHLCTKDQGDLDAEEFGAENDPDGAVELTVDSVEVNGDRATAGITSKSENEDEPNSEDLIFVREDGDWKACPSESAN